MDWQKTTDAHKSLSLCTPRWRRSKNSTATMSLCVCSTLPTLTMWGVDSSEEKEAKKKVSFKRRRFSLVYGVRGVVMTSGRHPTHAIYHALRRHPIRILSVGVFTAPSCCNARRMAVPRSTLVSSQLLASQLKILDATKAMFREMLSSSRTCCTRKHELSCTSPRRVVTRR